MSIQAQGNSDPGRLDRRVELQYPIGTRDSAGGESVTWFEAADVWAQKTFMRAGKMYAGEAKHYESSLSYRIRHRSDVAEGWRLVHGDDIYEIVSLEEMGRQHLVELFVRGVDQSPGSVISGFILHNGLPFLLHSAASDFLTLHREQDAA